MIINTVELRAVFTPQTVELPYDCEILDVNPIYTVVYTTQHKGPLIDYDFLILKDGDEIPDAYHWIGSHNGRHVFFKGE